MRTVELFEEGMRVAEQMGYRIRQEWMGGSGGGACEFGGRRWIFVDLSLSVPEQLDQVTDALRRDPAIHLQQLSPELGTLLDIRPAA